MSISLNAFGYRMCVLLSKLMRGLGEYERNYLTRGVISFPQLWALEHLREHGACTMNELAKAMQSRGSTASGLVDRMTTLRLVRRVRSREDRRVVHASITPKGKRVVDQINRHRQRMVVEMFRPLTVQDRQRHLEIIGKLVHQFSVDKPKDRRR
jgi:DNA-binding MarR family transcriptional regulator